MEASGRAERSRPSGTQQAHKQAYPVLKGAQEREQGRLQGPAAGGPTPRRRFGDIQIQNADEFVVLSFFVIAKKKRANLYYLVIIKEEKS